MRINNTELNELIHCVNSASANLQGLGEGDKTVLTRIFNEATAQEQGFDNFEVEGLDTDLAALRGRVVSLPEVPERGRLRRGISRVGAWLTRAAPDPLSSAFTEASHKHQREFTVSERMTFLMDDMRDLAALRNGPEDQTAGNYPLAISQLHRSQGIENGDCLRNIHKQMMQALLAQVDPSLEERLGNEYLFEQSNLSAFPWRHVNIGGGYDILFPKRTPHYNNGRSEEVLFTYYRDAHIWVQQLAGLDADTQQRAQALFLREMQYIHDHKHYSARIEMPENAPPALGIKPAK